MKQTRRFFAILLAVVLTLSLSVTAFAEGDEGTSTTIPTGTITIDNAVKDTKYNIYRILDMDMNADGTAFHYIVNSKWESFFTANDDGTKSCMVDGKIYLTVDAAGNVAKTDDFNVAEFAKAAKNFAEKHTIAADGTQTASSSEVKFEKIPLGYYLLSSGLGATCSLDTNNPDVTIREKNSESTLDKEIVDNSRVDPKTNDAAVGDTVNFKITAKVIDGNPVKYVIHDTMSAGLTFNSDVKVTQNGAELAAEGNYTVVTTGLSDGCSFHIVFTDDVDEAQKPTKSHALKPNDVIVVEYSATLNDKAVVKEAANTNKAKLVYGNESKETTEVITRTFSLQLDAFKRNKNDKGLANAKFKLYRMNGGKTEYAVLDSQYKVTSWTETEAGGTEITTPETGKFTVKGLDAGQYFLKETAAPSGYNKLTEDVKIVISATYDNNVATIKYTYKVGESETEANEVSILNQTGATLPSTGGIGTTIFYALGSFLALGAVILLVTKKRMAA